MPKCFQRSALMLGFLAVGAAAHAADPQFEKGREAILSMTGCYLVDYSYAETESLKPGYVRDSRIYDVNADKSIKEWIYAEELSPTRIRLQHILFGADLQGRLMDGSELRHQAEDWEFDAPFLYEFVAPSVWEVKALRADAPTWTRRITNLDDGLRYQCAARWNEASAFPEWSCQNYAPIPGRETRDMGRRDYDALMRTTRIVAYGGSWLERQANTKFIDRAGVKEPLAKELGKNWYVRLPDSECASARDYFEPRKKFWTLLREVWDGVLVGDRAFRERPVAGQPNRYMRIMGLEEPALATDLSNPATRSELMAKIRSLIEAYRAP